MEKNRKKIVLLLAIVLSLSGCWFIGQQIHGTSDEEENLTDTKDYLVSDESTEVIVTENLLDWDTVTYEGNASTDDNPWNVTAGTIELEDRGASAFLTPNTSVIFTISKQVDVFSFCYEIHPWVKENSDGADLEILLLDEAENVLYKEDIFVNASDELETFQVDLDEYKDVERIKVLCHSGTNNNENGDWVILSEVQGKVDSALGKEGYVKSATYFADEWPINFWNSEMDHLEADMQQIKQDGFNSIILVIPWREFQNSTDPISYNDYAFDALDKVVNVAKDNELDVYVRIGYTWDFYNDAEANIVDQFASLLSDKQTQDAWFDYVERMYSVLCQYENFKGGFLTWEDQWNTLGMCDEIDLNSRLQHAKDTGYQVWVQEHYGLDLYNEEYGTDYKSYEEIALPTREEPAMYAMFDFYDYFLNTLLSQSQEYFPNLSMEVRIDWDVTYDKNGEMKYYEHESTYSCQNSDFISLMYGIPMGYENVGERVSYSDALEKTEYILSQLDSKSNGKGIYVEQFIFADNTPAFANNAQIKSDEIDDYLLNVSDVLQTYSEGYGIWTYRNYCANMLYNSQFALEESGWETEGDVVFGAYGESNACTISKGGKLEQQIPEIRNHFDSETYQFIYDVLDVKDTAKVAVSMGSEAQVVEVSRKGTIALSFNKNEAFDIKIFVLEGQITIDNIKLYSQVQEGFLYDEKGNELSCIESLRALNKELN